VAYTIKIIPRGQRDLDSILGKQFDAIKEAILNLKDNPRPYGAIKLTAEEGYRIRIGDTRVLYKMDDKKKEIIIYRVKHRKDVYR
jgi:mRNA interferase RelE/StbE